MEIDLKKRRELFLVKPAIVDKNGIKHPIDEEIGRLLTTRHNDISEQDIINVLKEYNLKESLIIIGNYSRYLFHHNTDGFGQAGHCVKEFDIIITQFALAYVANILILSGANNDGKKTFKDDPYSLLTLCNIYSNKLITPELLIIEKGGDLNRDSLISLMVRMWYEQMSTVQFSVIYLMTRNIAFFNILASQYKPKNFDYLSNIFLNENGITIDEFTKIGFGFFAGSRDHSVFKASYLYSSVIEKMKLVYSEKKVNNFLKILSTDYSDFKNFDNAVNKSLNSIYTKNRFNPLFVWPFIREDLDGENVFIVPNVASFVYKTFGGIFWWFNNYFENLDDKRKLHLDYRDYFGSYIFEEYVGLILHGIYKKKTIYHEIAYEKEQNKFTDWCVVDENKCYLFEAKACQFALLSKQTGDLNIIIENELKKVIEAIVELYKNVKDIDKFDELKFLRNKKIIPVIVFLEFPLISSNLYTEKIKAILLEKDAGNLSGIKDFEFYMLNIDELELFDCVKDKIYIEEVFEIVKNQYEKGFTGELSKLNDGRTLRNEFLDKVYDDFGSSLKI